MSKQELKDDILKAIDKENNRVFLFLGVGTEGANQVVYGVEGRIDVIHLVGELEAIKAELFTRVKIADMMEILEKDMALREKPEQLDS